MTTATVIVEFRNAGSHVYQFERKKEITVDKWIESIHRWLVENEDFNELKDNFTVVDKPIKVELN